MSCWKVMREDGLNVDVGEYCLHKTLDYYYLSRDKLEEDISNDYYVFG